MTACTKSVVLVLPPISMVKNWKKGQKSEISGKIGRNAKLISAVSSPKPHQVCSGEKDARPFLGGRRNEDFRQIRWKCLYLYIWVIDEAWGQDGWIMTKFFFAILLTETKSMSIKTQKTKIRTIFSHLDRTILVNKRSIIRPKRELLLAGPTREIPSGKMSSYCPLG